MTRVIWCIQDDIETVSDFLEHIETTVSDTSSNRQSLNSQFEYSFDSNCKSNYTHIVLLCCSSQEEKAQAEQVHHPSDHRSYVDQVDSTAYSVENFGYIKRQGSRFELDELDPGSYRRVEEGRSESLRVELRSGERARE